MSVSFQTMESWARVNTASSTSVSCGPGGDSATVEGCQGGRIHGPEPSDLTGAGGGADGRWSGIGTAVVAPLNAGDVGSKAIKYPNTVFWAAANGALLNTWVVHVPWKTENVAVNNNIMQFGGITLRCSSAGKWQLLLGASTVTAATGPTALAVYDVEFAIYMHATLGTYELRVDGELIFSGSGVDTIGSGGAASGPLFTSTVGYIGPVYVSGGNGGYDASDLLTTAAAGIRISTMLPISQGGNSQFGHCGDGTYKDCFCGIFGVGGSTNWTYVTDATYHHKHKWLQNQTTNARDSWMGTALDPETIGTVLMVQTNIAVATLTGAVAHDGHLLRIAGTNCDHPDNNFFTGMGISNQVGYGCRAWPTKPIEVGGDAWTRTDFAAFEFGVHLQLVAFTGLVSDAYAMVAYLEPIPQTISDSEAECTPCTDSAGEFYVDSGKTHDGRNTAPLNALLTPPWDTTTLTMSLAPAGTWDAGGSHTLNASAAIFTGVSGDWVGKSFRLRVDEGEDSEQELIVDITGYTDTDTLTVVPRTDVPEAMQAVDIAVWALGIIELNLDHLEGMVVSILSDGLVQAQQTVTGGIVTLDDHGYRIAAGLPYTQRMRTVPLAPQAGEPTDDATKRVAEVSVLIETSVNFKLGSYDPIEDVDSTDRIECDPHVGEAGAQPTRLWTRDMVKQPVRDHGLNDTGQITIEQDQPLPMGLRGLILHVELGDS